MNNLRQAAQQALEALTLLQSDIEWTSKSPTLKFVNSTVAALRAALAEPEQDELDRLHAENEAMKEALKEAKKLDAEANALAASSIALADSVDQLRAALAEPQTTHWEGCEAVHPECRAIPRRPLTHEEIEALDNLPVCPSDAEVITFVRKIERAHGIGAKE